MLSHAALSLDLGASIHDPIGVEFGKAVMKNSRMKGVYPSKKIGKISSILYAREKIMIY